MNTIFRKILTKDRLPKIQTRYITNDGWLSFEVESKSFHHSNIFDEQYFPEWWLEEIELPSQKDICLKSELRCSPKDTFNEKGFWIWGANWMKDFVLGCSPISEREAKNK